jgi:hypothetical protein
VWQFGIYPTDETRIRFVTRSRVTARTLLGWVMTCAIEPAGFIMTRRMLLGLKERAEATRAARAMGERANLHPAA